MGLGGDLRGCTFHQSNSSRIGGREILENSKSYESEYKFKIGDEIFHEKYGYGVIKYIVDDKYEIVFDKLSKTKIVLENFIKHA